jgi:hypothetical protein
MIDLAVTAVLAKDATEDQFAPGPRRAVPASAPAAAVRAPVRRRAVRALRFAADRLEPAPRYAPQS